MPVKRTSHAVYDTKYHLVWAPKYRKWIVRADIRGRIAELFPQIAGDFGFIVDPRIQTTSLVRLGRGLKGGRDGENTGQA